MLIFIALIAIIGSGLFYIYQITNIQDQLKGMMIIGKASQVTFSCFICGLGVIIALLNIFSLKRSQFQNILIYYGAAVALVNVFSIIFYKRRFNKKNQS